MVHSPPPADREIRGYGRVLDVLETVADSARGLTLSEFSRQLNIPKSTTSLILDRLADRGYLVCPQGDRRFAMGPRLVQLAIRIAGEYKLPSAARPYLEHLSRQTNEDVYLAVRTGTEVIYVDKVEGVQSVQIRVGLGVPRPIHSTAAGRVFLAFEGPALLEKVISDHGLPRLTDRTITDPDGLANDLARIRERGYALSDGQTLEGLTAVAAPVRTRDGRTLAALAVAGVGARMQAHLPDIVATLLAATGELQHVLGSGTQFTSKGGSA